MVINRFERKSQKAQYAWWAGSYCAIIILSILINMVGYTVAVRVVKAQTQRGNQAILEHTKGLYDVYFENISTLAARLLQTPAASTLVHSNQLTEEEIQSYGKELLSAMRYRDSVIANIYMVFPEQDLEIGDGIASLDIAYAMGFREYFNSKDEWLSDLFRIKGYRYQVLTGKDNVKRVFFYYVMPTIFGQSKAAVVIEFNSNIVSNMLRGEVEKEKKDNLIILNEDNTVLFSANSEVMASDYREETVYTENIGNEPYTFNRIGSDVVPVSYVYSMPTRQIDGQLNMVRWGFILSYFLCIFVCGGLAAYFSNVNYKRHKKIQRELKEKTAYISANLLRQLLKGKTKLSGENTALLNENGIVFSGNAFLVLGFAFADQQEENPQRGEKLVVYVRKSICKILEDYGKVYFTDLDETYAGIICFYDEIYEVSELAAQLEILAAKMKEDYGVHLICGIGSIITGISRVYESYKAALSVMDRCFVEQDKNVFVYGETTDGTFIYKYDIETEVRLMELLLKGKSEEALRFVDYIFSMNKKLNLNALKVFALEVSNTVFKAATQAHQNDELDYPYFFELNEKISDVKQMEQAKELIKELAEKMCVISVDTTQRTDDFRLQKIIQYIGENYADPDLNVNMMARVFEMSPSYMSRYFKSKMGEGMTDYIVKIRITKAKELLKTTNHSISQTAAQVGFSSVAVFMRAFKRLEGITAGEFRESIG